MRESFQVTNHPDPADQALDLTETRKEASVQAVRDQLVPKQVQNPDGSWPEPDCVLCGDPIGEGRLEATGSDICINCATMHEKKGRFYANR